MKVHVASEQKRNCRAGLIGEAPNPLYRPRKPKTPQRGQGAGLRPTETRVEDISSRWRSRREWERRRLPGSTKRARQNFEEDATYVGTGKTTLSSGRAQRNREAVVLMRATAHVMPRGKNRPEPNETGDHPRPFGQNDLWLKPEPQIQSGYFGRRPKAGEIGNNGDIVQQEKVRFSIQWQQVNFW